MWRGHLLLSLRRILVVCCHRSNHRWPQNDSWYRRKTYRCRKRTGIDAVFAKTSVYIILHLRICPWKDKWGTYNTRSAVHLHRGLYQTRHSIFHGWNTLNRHRNLPKQKNLYSIGADRGKRNIYDCGERMVSRVAFCMIRICVLRFVWLGFVCCVLYD